MAEALAVIAGGGELPVRLVEACRAGGRAVLVVALEGQADPALFPAGPDTRWFRLGAGGAMLAWLKERGAAEVVMAGRVRRPSLTELRPDGRTLQFFTRIGLKALGDDGLLRAVTDELAREGLRVVGVQDLLDGLLTPAGALGGLAPDESALADIRHGMRVARLLGRADVGQAVVVQQGLVLGVEAIEGTDALIRRCADLKREGPGPVLVKMRKPQQDRRLDLPTIGPDTVRQCAGAGFAGIAAEAGGTLALNQTMIAEVADAAGLFVVGVTPDGDDGA